MPEDAEWHWYVEEFAPAEQHHHAIDEVYYSGRSEFQQIAVLRSPVFGKMLVLDGDTQSAQADERIYHEALVHPALAGAADRARGADPRRRRGRDAARGAALPRRASLHDGRHRRPRGRALEDVSAGMVGRGVRRRARARRRRRRARVHARERRALRRDPFRSHRAARGLAEQSALQRRGLPPDQVAARRGRHLRAAGEHRGGAQRRAALQDGAHAAPPLRARRLLLHARAGLRYRVGLPRLQRSRRPREPRSRTHRRLLRRACAARASFTTR